MFNLGSALGIEVRGSDLVFATVKKGIQDFTLQHSSVIEDYQELTSAELYNRIQNHLQVNGFNGENVVLGLPRDQAVIRYVELPLEVEENLAQVVRFQVAKFEPTEEERSCYDYLVLDRDEERNKIWLQIIMVRRTVLDEYLNLFREVNLYPAAVRLSSVALHQVFSVHEDGYSEKDPSVVLDINSEAVEIVVVAGSERFFSEKVFMDQNELTVDRLICELNVFLSHLNLPGQGVSKIYLAGLHGSRFVEEFQARFEDCEPLLEKVRLKQKNSPVSNLEERVNSIGLAISGMSKSRPSRFNLIPPEKRLVKARPSLMPTFLLVGLLLILGVFWGTREYFQHRELLDQIETRVQRLRPEVERAMVQKSQLEEQQVLLTEFKNLMKGRQQILFILEELTEKIPENTFLQSLSVQGKKVTMIGYSDAASNLLPILLNSQHMENVVSKYITPERRMSNREKFHFEAAVKE